MTKKKSATRKAAEMLAAGWDADVVAGYLYMRTLDQAGVSIEEAGGFYGLPHAVVTTS